MQRAIVTSDRTEQRWCLPELWRMRGELFIWGAQRDPAEAARSFGRALSMARSQGARLWELRTATVLARLLAEQGQRTQAQQLLEPVYAWFTEGFDCPDLQDASALLAELG